MKKLPHLTLPLALALVGFSTARANPTYSVIDLGVAAGSSSRATGVNDSGQVVGNIFNDNYGDGATGNTAFRYSYAGTGAGLMESLRYDTPNPSDPSIYGPILHHGTAAYAINNAGQIAGAIDLYGWTAPVLTGGIASAASAGAYASITNPGGSITFPMNPGSGPGKAYAINSSGQVAGFTNPYYGNFGQEASVTDSGGNWVKLMERYSYGYGINDSGQVVGRGGSTGAFLYSGGVVTEINNTSGGANVNLIANDINNNGIVVGLEYPDGGHPQAYRRDANGAMFHLGYLSTDDYGALASEALAVNDSGMIVGSAATVGAYHAFLYSQADGGMIDLNNYLSNDAHMTLTAATAISENGYIAGYGISSLDGQEHAFLLAPPTSSSSVPETGATAGLMLMGLAGMAGVRRLVAARTASV